MMWRTWKWDHIGGADILHFDLEGHTPDDVAWTITLGPDETTVQAPCLDHPARAKICAYCADCATDHVCSIWSDDVQPACEHYLPELPVGIGVSVCLGMMIALSRVYPHIRRRRR